MSNGTDVKAPYAAERRVMACIGKAVRVEGKVIGGEDLTIDGDAEGSIELGGHCLTIGQDANIKADLIAKAVTISGKVRGNVKRVEKVYLSPTASVQGDITRCASAWPMARRSREDSRRLGRRQAGTRNVELFSFAGADGGHRPFLHLRASHNRKAEAKPRCARLTRASPCLKRSNTWKKSGEMPMPVSATTNSTRDSVTASVTRSAPPSGVNLMPFASRFQTTC